MANINKLRGAIAERGYSLKRLADETAINYRTLRRRFENGENFRVGEVEAIRETLSLTPDEVHLIFFDEEVAN